MLKHTAEFIHNKRTITYTSHSFQKITAVKFVLLTHSLETRKRTTCNFGGTTVSVASILCFWAGTYIAFSQQK